MSEVSGEMDPMTISYRLVAPPTAPDIDLTSDQKLVSGHRRGVLLVLGGPRTGRTTCLIEATIEALRAEAPHVLFIAGSRRARLGLRASVGSRVPHLSSRLTVSTFDSFCQSVVQRFGPEPIAPQVLSAARQDAVVRQLLADSTAESWPESFALARTTPRFAADVREAMAACQRGGLSPADVARLGAEQNRPEWVGLARFFEEYLDVLGMWGYLDYPEFLTRAGGLLDDEQVLAAVRPTGSLVVVDGWEDLDGAQVEIVHRLVDVSSPTILAADPDRQVYGFRGSRSRSMGQILEQWSHSGVPTATVSLNQGHGVSRAVVDACEGTRGRIPLPVGMDVGVLDAYRRLAPDTAGAVTKIQFADPISEADHIAALLKRAHVITGIPYEQMAILVRTRAQFPSYQTACDQADVPVVTSGDEIQLNREKIVWTLLAALRLVRDQGVGSQADKDLIAQSPLGSDPVPQGTPDQEPQDEPVERDSGDVEDAVDEQVGQSRWERVMAAGRSAMGGSVGDVLWAVWNESKWEESLVDALSEGGTVAARAHHSLDAVMALFALASTWSQLPSGKGIATVLEAVAAQEIPEDLPRSASWTSPAVRLTTAHRAKADSWSLVVVAAVEEGVWPARAPMSTMVPLDGLVPSAMDDRERMMAERRLLYTACSAARDTLVVTAVADDDRSPSFFFEQIDATTITASQGPHVDPVSSAALVGRLRTVASDDTCHPGLRQAACDRLAWMSENRVFRGADPKVWWGVGDAVHGGDPDVTESPGSADLARSAGPIVVAASQMDSLFECPRRWFLSRQAQGERAPGARTRIGSIVHALVQDPSMSLDEMIDRLDAVLDDVSFPAAWMRRTEAEQATAALERYDAYRRATRREVLASEVDVEFSVDVPGSSPVRVRGRIDSIERDDQSRVWIVDFKTGKALPTKAQVAAHTQLGVYQLAALEHAVPGVDPAMLAGAELVYLRHPDSRGSQLPKVFSQECLREVPHLTQEVKLPVMGSSLVRDLPDQWSFPTWVHHRVAVAARVIAADTRPAIASTCRTCPFTHGCPVTTSQEASR